MSEFKEGPFRNKKLVMLLDGDAHTMVFMRAILEESAYGVIQISDLGNCHEKILEVRPNLIIVDIESPTEEVIETFGKIRNCKQAGGIPVIMVTSENVSDIEETDLLTERSLVITKPFSIDEFVGKVEEMVGK